MFLGRNFLLFTPPLLIPTGGHRAAEDHAGLAERKISHVLTVANNLDELEVPPKSSGIAHKCLLVDDDEKDISTFFDEAFAFLREARSKRRGALVHCAAGQNRSATIVLAWRVAEERVLLFPAYRELWIRRPYVCPRARHLRRLLDLERGVFGGSSCFLHHLESGRVMPHIRLLELLEKHWP
jgi:hypothetical protein